MTSPSRLDYRFCARTDCGRVRANNEDAVAMAPEVGVAILADGMGGYNAGEVASSMATTLVRDGMARWLAEAGPQVQTTDVRKALEACVQEANLAVLDASLQQPQYAGMGTTLVAGVFLAERLVLGHVGDSRCYRLRHGSLQQITRDHSWLQEQLDAGLMTPRQAAQSGHRNLVTRALGVDADGSHAFYLGVELARAQIAFQLGKRYAQDNELRWGCAVPPPPEDHLRHAAPGSTLEARRRRQRREQG